MSATGIADAVRRGALSAREVAGAALRAAAERDADLRAFREIWPQQALHRAAEVDRMVARGTAPPLAGVPIAVKATEGTASFQSARLASAGCIPVGSTSVPDRAHGWQTFGSTDRGLTANPFNPAWSPGGSSAGSATAVAARIVPLATGSDGAGSVRIPAAWCGVLGFKPTGGLLPARDAAGLSTPGPLTRTAADAAAYLRATSGLPQFLGRPPACSVAWSATLGFASTAPRIARTARLALQRLIAAGLLTEAAYEVELLDPAPVWSALRHRSPPAEGAGAIAAGNRRRLGEAFRAVDLIATPTTPNPPHGHDGPGDQMSVALTWAFNISGHPAISIPAGFTPLGEPVGLHLVAPPGGDGLLLRLAAAAEHTAP